MTTVGPELGSLIIGAIKRAGVEFVLSLPDILTSEHVLWPIARDPDLCLVRVCKEDEGIAISAALAYCDKRALVLIQHTGLLDSINALRAIGVDQQAPVCLLVGLQGREPGIAPRESAEYGVRIVVPLLDAMGIAHCLVETPADAAKIAPAVDDAYAGARPVVILV